VVCGAVCGMVDVVWCLWCVAPSRLPCMRVYLCVWCGVVCCMVWCGAVWHLIFHACLGLCGLVYGVCGMCGASFVVCVCKCLWCVVCVR
jgi:hypothetical protein